MTTAWSSVETEFGVLDKMDLLYHQSTTPAISATNGDRELEDDKRFPEVKGRAAGRTVSLLAPRQA